MSFEKVIISRSEEETINYGKKFAGSLRAGDIVLLYGELGSGKTRFVKGIAQYFNVKDTVNSPTFIIVNEYAGIDPVSSSPINIYHFDLYRLENTAEVAHIGFGDYLDPGSLVLIEWPEKAEPLLPGKYKAVKFNSGESEKIREISFNSA